MGFNSGFKGLILYQMSNAFVKIKMCYLYNRWYDISCATLYLKPGMIKVDSWGCIIAFWCMQFTLCGWGSEICEVTENLACTLYEGGWAVQGLGLRPLACWDCGFKSPWGHGCLSVVSVVCCQVEVCAMSWSFVQSVVRGVNEEALAHWGAVAPKTNEHLGWGEISEYRFQGLLSIFIFGGEVVELYNLHVRM